MATRRRFLEGILAAGSLPVIARAHTSSEDGAVIVRGRVVCLTEELEREMQIATDCDKRGHVYSLKTSDGRLTFLPTDTAAAIFDDARIRERNLRVTARAIPGTSFIEVIKLQSVRAGRIYELFYYCDVCAITTHKPGPCACCQDPVVFHEELSKEQPQP